jgi:hypothetical protein
MTVRAVPFERVAQLSLKQLCRIFLKQTGERRFIRCYQVDIGFTVDSGIS